MEKEGKEKIYKKWWFWLIIILLLILIGNYNSNNTEIKSTSDLENTVTSNSDNTEVTLLHGELVNFMDDTNVDTNKYYCVIKAKIESSYSNKATIDQNFYNVEDFIKNQNGTKYDEIQYWAVADMSSGEEAKVISFTLDKDIINKIYNTEIPLNQLQDYLSDIWILPSLQN